MNDLQQFTSAQFGDIRALSLDGEPWFVGKDVAHVLGYSNTKVTGKGQTYFIHRFLAAG